MQRFVPYYTFFDQTLRQVGFDVAGQWNTFSAPHSPDTGWPLKLPCPEFNRNTVVALHFQDFVTSRDQQIIELQQVEQFYGARANQVAVIHWTHDLASSYSGPINLIEFNVHEYNLVQNLRQQKSQWLDAVSRPKTQPWQCLNGAVRDHRRRTADVLTTWPGGTLSLGHRIPLAESPYSEYRFDSEANFSKLLPVYSRCAVNIVNETQYDTRPGIVTEKTMMALLSQQVPIVIGHQGIVQDCVELGFDMFTDLVNTEYDWAPNDSRAEQALWLNQDLICGKINLQPYHSRLQHQQNWLLDTYPERLRQQFETHCQQLAQKLLS